MFPEDSWKKNLRTHLRDPDSLMKYWANDIVNNLFDFDPIKTLTDEDPYNGKIICLYKFENYYFTVSANYGTCELCDEYAIDTYNGVFDSEEKADKKEQIERLFDSIEKSDNIPEKFKECEKTMNEVS